MRHLAIGALTLALAASAPAAAESCSTGRPVPLIDAVPAVNAASVITLAASPALEHPTRAWVVRLWRRGYAGPAELEIYRLRRPDDCAHFEVEDEWRGPLAPEPFAQVAEAAARHVAPPGGTLSALAPPPPPSQIVMDGTSLTLRMQVGEREATRQLNHYADDGKAISGLFHALAEGVVPAGDIPTADWRTH